MFITVPTVCALVASDEIVVTRIDEQDRSPQNTMLRDAWRLWRSKNIPYVLYPGLGKCKILIASG